MSRLLDRRLIFVTGKGGVGKSTVALALGALAARRGRRTIVAEIAGQDRAAHAFDRDGGRFTEVALAEGLSAISVDPESAMEEYLRLRTGSVGQALGASRVFQAFAMATPGMRELLTMGKVWELAQFERRTREGEPYDVVILDAPAAGHGLGLLRTPRTFADLARVGPVGSLARRIAATIADPAFTAVCAVATPEEMSVNETVWLAEALGTEGLALEAVFLNGLYAQPFTRAEIRTLQRARSDADPTAGAILAAALSTSARAQAQREQLARLRGALTAPVGELPHLSAETFGPTEIAILADALSDTGPLR